MSFQPMTQFNRCSHEIQKKVKDALRKRLSLDNAKMVQNWIIIHSINSHHGPYLFPIPPHSVPQKHRQLIKQLIATYLVFMEPKMPEETKQSVYQDPWLARKIYATIIYPAT